MNKVKKIVALSLALSSVTGSIIQARDSGDYIVDAAVVVVGAVGCYYGYNYLYSHQKEKKAENSSNVSVDQGEVQKFNPTEKKASEEFENKKKLNEEETNRKLRDEQRKDSFNQRQLEQAINKAMFEEYL